MRWRAPDGKIWASCFEYEVYLAAKSYCEPTGEQDALAYRSNVRGGICVECGSTHVAQERRYTPDLLCGSERAGKLFYIEAKGYLRQERRSLLRAFRTARPEIDLRIIVQKDYKITKTMTIVEWVKRYLKIPVHVWDGNIPGDWK